MDRRAFLGALASSILASPLVVEAQPAQGIRRIGVVEAADKPLSEARKEGLRRLGWIEGQNIVVEQLRWGDRSAAAFQKLAQEIVRLKVEVVIASSNTHITAAKAATTTIPIVMVYAADPVGQGFVASLARPGGNITGLSVIDVDMSTKQLELLKAISPKLSRVAVLLNPGNPANPAVLKHVQASAPALGVEVVAVSAATPQAIESAFAEAARAGAGAVIVAADAFFSGQGPQLAASALAQRLATISLYQDHVSAGCLMNYGQNVADFHQRAARYVDKILKGAKPEDLPVEQPTKFDLVINKKTADLLGLAIPLELLVSADRVIE
jgi:putative ABC transport system substrate-binding protein